MRARVVYESMYGNTETVALAVAEGLRESIDVDVTRVGDVNDVSGFDLLVLGAPTHTWGLSRASTRRAATQAAGKPGSGLTMQPGASGPGMREWLDAMPTTTARVAAFDTHMRAPLGLSGSAARRIARHARHRGHEIVGAPKGFVVSKQNHLLDGELDRARAWGRRLADDIVATRRR